MNIDDTSLMRNLEKLGLDMERRIGKKAAAAAASKYASQIRKRIPVSGNDDVVLKKSIRSQAVKKRNGQHLIASRVGIIGDARLYAHLFEYGRQSVRPYEGARLFTDALSEFTDDALSIMKEKVSSEIKKHARS